MPRSFNGPAVRHYAVWSNLSCSLSLTPLSISLSFPGPQDDSSLTVSLSLSPFPSLFLPIFLPPDALYMAVSSLSPGRLQDGSTLSLPRTPSIWQYPLSPPDAFKNQDGSVLSLLQTTSRWQYPLFPPDDLKMTALSPSGRPQDVSPPPPLFPPGDLKMAALSLPRTTSRWQHLLTTVL